MDAAELPDLPEIPELPTDPATGRPLDPSTGRPRMITDDEARAEIAAKHAESWRDRIGEQVELVVLKDGLTAFGNVWMRGDTITAVVGDARWLDSIDPTTGQSWMDRDLKEQIRFHGRVMFCDATKLDAVRAEHPEADPRPRPDAGEMAARRAQIVRPPTATRRPDAPLPVVSAQTTIPKVNPEADESDPPAP